VQDLFIAEVSVLQFFEKKNLQKKNQFLLFRWLIFVPLTYFAKLLVHCPHLDSSIGIKRY